MKAFGSRLSISAAVLVGGLAGAVLPAAAQTKDQYPGATDVVPPTGQQPVPSPTVPPPPASQTSNSPFDGITAFGKNLADKGIYLSLGYTYDFNAAVSGGNYTGVSPTGELYFGTVLDLQKLFGIRGASFHVTFDERSGFGLNNYVGTQGPLEANSGPTRATRLSEFYWEQAFFNDRLDITVGRTNPTLDFATSDIACEFISSIICAQPGSWYFSNSNDAYPASTWGSRINIVPAPNFYFRTGAFEDNPSQLAGNQNGFNWNVEGATGVFIPAEVGYATSFKEARYPVKYDIGGYYDDATYTAPFASMSRGRSAFYIQGLQTIWRPNPNTKQSLQVFGGAIVYGPGAAYWGQYYAGLFDRAPLASRPDDTIGLIGSYYAMSSTYNPNKSNQWIFELNYGYKVYSGVSFKPYAQYVVNPNNVGLGIPGVPQPSNAWVVGFQVNIDLAAVFKLPTFVAY